MGADGKQDLLIDSEAIAFLRALEGENKALYKTAKSLYDKCRAAAPSFVRIRLVRSESGAVTAKEDIPYQRLSEFIHRDDVYRLVMQASRPAFLWAIKNGLWALSGKNEVKGRIAEYIDSYDPMARTPKNRTRDDPVAIKPSDINANKDLVHYENGTLNITTMKFSKAPIDRKLLSTIRVPCNYQPDIGFESAPVFKSYLNDLTYGDEGLIQLLLEVIGIALSNIPGHRMRKAVFMVGNADTGKTRFLLLLTKLLGEENVATIDLD